jgi:branched-chain amino acid transport system ATP-binding protein
MSPLLSVEDLEVGYDDMTVISGVSIAVDEGQLVSIVGSNSAGKSTLLNTLSGLIRPRRGSIRFQNREIAGLPPYRIVRTGIVQVPEARELFPDMSVRENLLSGALYGATRRGRQARMEELLELFPALREKLGLAARTLSGGQQQMLAILRALMCRPKLLMLDEPSFGLSPLLVRELLGAVKELNRRGTTILLVEQSIRQSLSICDFGYVLEHGRIALSGTGEALLNNERIVESYLGV